MALIERNEMILKETLLWEMILCQITLHEVTLSEIKNVRNGTLRNGTLRNCNLQFGTLGNGILWISSLRNCNLRRCALRNGILRNGNLRNVRIVIETWYVYFQLVFFLKSECYHWSNIWNIWEMNFAHITKLGKPQRETNHCMLFLAEYRVIFEKIDNNWIPPKGCFWSSEFQANLGTLRHKMKKTGLMKRTKSWKTTSKHMLTTIWAILDYLFTQSNWIYPTYFWLVTSYQWLE